MCVCVFVCVHACICEWLCAFVCVWACVRVRACMSVCMCLCECMHLCVCMCLCLHICVYGISSIELFTCVYTCCLYGVCDRVASAGVWTTSSSQLSVSWRHWLFLCVLPQLCSTPARRSPLPGTQRAPCLHMGRWESIEWWHKQCSTY